MIIDTSALVAIVLEEPEEPEFTKIIAAAENPRLSAANFLELSIVVDSRHNAAASGRMDTLLEEFGILIEPVTEAQARIAREAYRDFGRGSGHPAGLNFGDCFAYALAKDKRQTLLYKGDDFGHTDIRSALDAPRS